MIELVISLLFPVTIPFYTPHLPVIHDREPYTIEKSIARYSAIYGLSEGDTQRLQSIAYCESRYNPLAKNPNSTAKGLFQILDGTWNAYGCEGDVFDEHDNIVCAIKIYKRS